MEGEYEQFLLFGDSITEHSSTAGSFGFASALEQAYIRRLDVVNRGFSGYNTSQALKIISSVVPPPEKAKVRIMNLQMIFFGANDACYAEAQNGQHVPLEEYKDNLVKLLTHPSVLAQKPRLVLVTPPPVEERRLEALQKNQGYGELNRTAQRTKSYADAAREVGRAHQVAVLDLWSAFMKAADWKGAQDDGDETKLPGSRSVPENMTLGRMLYDGIHFDQDGYRVLFDEMMKLIKSTWPDQLPEALPYVLPAWDESAIWAKEGLRVGNEDAVRHD